ncbi:hypothetical protein GGF37_005014 [Kickxella alabastrina]|nr:hypothetical protein GGF37_005014 [Kickxella alabastrina]
MPMPMPMLAASRFSNITAGLSTSQIDSLRKQSRQLEDSMRLLKHIGDAERTVGGKVALEVVYYLEALTCGMEDFWIRRAFTSSADTLKNLLTMRNICEYVYKKCDSQNFLIIRGCAAMISACVYYQLTSISFELAREAQDADGVSKAVGDASQYFSEMDAYDQWSCRLLGAATISQQLPQLWQRCQESSGRLGAFEVRSDLYTENWPSVAYPVGASSNPLDVASFVRQVGREWLGRAGLALRIQGH